MLLTILESIILFIVTDKLLEKYNFNGIYYFNHFICNSIVVYNTFIPMITSYINMYEVTNDSLNISRGVVYGLHLYHILIYYNKLRFDDWLHHILMIGITLPLTSITTQTNIIAHGLFFTTGLPGLIDYYLLFLTRNNYIHKSCEKYVNTFINLWIRSPGCIMNATLGVHNLLNNYNTLSNIEIYSIIFILFSMYWNGIYFMNQTVQDFTLYKYKMTISSTIG
jgi:hypothetical protein